MISDQELITYKKKYAKLIAVIGLNDVKNQIISVQADLDDPEFVTYVVDELYKRGAKRVEVDWVYRPVLKTIYQNTSKEELCKIYPHQIAKLKRNADKLVRRLLIESESPDWMDGVDVNKVAAAQSALAKAAKPFKEKMRKVETPWCIATIPGAEWAKKLFPKLNEKDAIKKLWEKIIICCRLKGDPIKNWQKYNKDIRNKCNYLNSLHIKSLHYTSKSTGTDLVVGINPHTKYCGGAHDLDNHKAYDPNMPAVECFNTPDKYVTEGIAVSTKPLSRNGQLMEQFKIRFHKGRIVEVHAKKGEAFLKKLIDTDEGSHYLGEAALVPFNSPVSNTNMTYFKTILDENAACHLAFGEAISTTFLKEVHGLNDKELDKKGINTSSIHIDFMIGCKDLNIVATTRSGKKVAIFKNGNWAK